MPPDLRPDTGSEFTEFRDKPDLLNILFMNMKKIYFLLLGSLLMCGGAMTSCTSDESGGGSTSLPENTFSVGDAQHSIASVVYTVDKDTKVYTFYFSPTGGLMDLDAMLMADDYIKIVTKSPAGDLAAYDKNGSVSYKGAEVSVSELTGSSSLYVLMGSVSTVKMDLNVTLPSGEPLVGNYYGYCVYHSEGGDSGEVEQIPTLTTQIFARYKGTAKNAGTNNYFVAVTNTTFTLGSTADSFTLTDEGYALVLDFYGPQSDNWKDFPVGTFTESPEKGDHTWYFDYSYVLHRDAQGTETRLALCDDVTIQRDGSSDQVTITTRCLDAEYNEYKEYDISFTGDLRMANGTIESYLPMYEDNIEFEGYSCVGAFYVGDLYSTGSGLVSLTFNDFKWDNRENGGYSATILLCGRKFNDKREVTIVEGPYTASSTYSQQGTWRTGYDDLSFSMFGLVVPGGTYVSYRPDAKNNQYDRYAYGASGEINVSKVEKGYRIEFDLISAPGFSVKGFYEGPIYLDDISQDERDDGSSTLESDLDLNLEKFDRAYCYPQTEIYFGDAGYKTLDYITSANPGGEASGFQIIEIGNSEMFRRSEPGTIPATDVFQIELLVKPGTDGQITPGVYPITENRYPVRFKPGVSPRGYMHTDGALGTRWEKVVEAIGNRWDDENNNGIQDPGEVKENVPVGEPTLGGYACVYAGTVTVEKVEGKGDNYFKFTIDGEDVLHHKIRGSWEGPVYQKVESGQVGEDGKPIYDEVPVVSSGYEFPATTTSSAAGRLSARKLTPERLSAMSSAERDQLLSTLGARRIDNASFR